MTNESGTPLRTPLHALHLRCGAKMVPFAGYEMPLQFPSGILKEHLHTRQAAGLFDVSHMGQIEVRARAGTQSDVARALERLIPIDVAGLPPGRQRYGLLTTKTGGIIDDLMVLNAGDRFVLVVNAARKAEDASHLRVHLPDAIELNVLPHALIALQGPKAEAALARLAPDVAGMRFMDVRAIDLLGAPALVTRSGYTGEDGFEISVRPARAEAVAETLLADDSVQPVGLGARDSLRLEAGLCLHGSDIYIDTTPVEAALSWAIPPVRRRGGAREGDFPGAGIILDQLTHGATRRRVGLRPNGRTPVRSGALLFADASSTTPIGSVTSGGFGPTLQAPVAMGYVPSDLAAPGRQVSADVRGERLALTVAALPFVPPGFKRN